MCSGGGQAKCFRFFSIVVLYIGVTVFTLLFVLESLKVC